MAENLMLEVNALMEEQLSVWRQAADNYGALSHVSVKELDIDGFRIKVQFNSARIVSSAAKVDSKSISERKCFLCASNRPEVQKGVPFHGVSGDFTVLVNPFPIFPRHLTIPSDNHTPQLISGRFADMLSLAESLPEYVLFYNGPKCGASAPDHMHFQAGNKGFLPMEYAFDDVRKKLIWERRNVSVYSLDSFLRTSFALVSDDVRSLAGEFDRIFGYLPVKEGENEPMLNVLAWHDGNRYVSIVVLRKNHRPSCFFAEGEANILISPASVDMGGVFITPLEKDFGKIGAEDVAGILDEVLMDEADFNVLIDKLK